MILIQDQSSQATYAIFASESALVATSWLQIINANSYLVGIRVLLPSIASSKVAFQRFVLILRGMLSIELQLHIRCTIINIIFIFRHSDHFKIYKDKCEKLEIPMNEWAFPKADEALIWYVFDLRVNFVS